MIAIQPEIFLADYEVAAEIPSINVNLRCRIKWY